MSTYFTQVILLTVGGAIGTNARYWLSVFILHHYKSWLSGPTAHLIAPLAFFVINVTGSLLLGALVPFRERWHMAWIFLGVGFCGGYTTFSSFALDNVELVRRYHQPGMAMLNVAASVVVACIACWLAMASVEQISPPPAPAVEVEGPAISVREATDPGTQTAP